MESIISVWDPSKSYELGEVVLLFDSIFIVVGDNNPTPLERMPRAIREYSAELKSDSNELTFIKGLRHVRLI